MNLRTFISRLRKNHELIDIYEEVDPDLEIAEIHRRVIEQSGPALFFHRVKGSSFPVVTNLFGTQKRVEIAFDNRPEETVSELVKLFTSSLPPNFFSLWKKRKTLKQLLYLGTKKRKNAPILANIQTPPDLEALPLLKSWPLDGGAFITLPLVYTESPKHKGANLGMYRIQRFNPTQTGLHFQIGKGGGFHYHLAEQEQIDLPVTIFIGGPPALMLSAIAPLPENLSELLLCGLLQGAKLGVTKIKDYPHPLIGECEFALMGSAKPFIRKPEGPFGDHYGYYSLTHDFPVFECGQIAYRNDAIYPATVVGKPKQEDFFIGDYLQKLLSPLLSIAMPGVKSLWSYGETGFHSLAAAVVHERYHRECMASAFRILGEGQLSFTKFLFLTDQLIDVSDFKKVLQTVLERCNPQSDLFIFSNLCLDTLDYTGPALNEGSRGVMLGIGTKKRDLPEVFIGSLPLGIGKAALFCPGCLVLEGPSYETSYSLDIITTHPSFSEFPLIVLVDNLAKALKDTTSFLWTLFTRFEPAADIYTNTHKTIRHHIAYSFPILIDARMKPSYPPEVEVDLETASLVTKKWNSYFPKGMDCIK